MVQTTEKGLRMRIDIEALIHQLLVFREEAQHLQELAMHSGNHNLSRYWREVEGETWGLLRTLDRRDTVEQAS